MSFKSNFDSMSQEEKGVHANPPLTWKDMSSKYPEYRDEMNAAREAEFVNDCYRLYEQEGFAKEFWSVGGDFKEYIGQPFQVIGRVSVDDADLECLPMWKIQFEDGTVIDAYPDEIVPSEMRDNGWKERAMEFYVEKEKQAMSCLADYETGRGSPGVLHSNLAKHLGLSADNVEKVVKSLLDYGFIEVDEWWSDEFQEALYVSTPAGRECDEYQGVLIMNYVKEMYEHCERIEYGSHYDCRDAISQEYSVMGNYFTDLDAQFVYSWADKQIAMEWTKYDDYIDELMESGVIKISDSDLGLKRISPEKITYVPKSERASQDLSCDEKTAINSQEDFNALLSQPLDNNRSDAQKKQSHERF